MAAPLSKRVMVDPSLLLSNEGFAWLQEDPAVLNGIVVSETVMRWFQHSIDLNRRLFIAPEDLDTIDERRERLVGLFAEAQVPKFSFQDVRLSPEHSEVLQNLLDVGGRPGLPGRRRSSIYADEWAFLQSQSTLVSKLRNPVDAFRDAGSIIVELGRKTGRNLIFQVIPKEHVPSVLTRSFVAKATVKWIVVGGAAAGGGTLAGFAASAVGGPIAGMAVGGVGRKFGDALAVAIDP